MPNKINNEEILDEFTMEESLNHMVLKNYIDKYPSLALELVDLYHELMLTDARVAAESIEPQTKQMVSPKIFENTNVEAALTGDELRSLAKKVGLPRDFFAGFRDRKIRFGSIPEPIVTGLANQLGVAIHALIEFLRSPPRSGSGFAFKAEGKPNESAVIDYDEFLDSLALTDQEKSALERLCHIHGRS